MSRTSYARVGLVTGLILLVPLVANQFTDGEAGASSTSYRGRPAGGNRTAARAGGAQASQHRLRVAAAVIAVAAIVLGEADDAPGLVLFGCLLILGTVALSLRSAQRSE